MCYSWQSDVKNIYISYVIDFDGIELTLFISCRVCWSDSPMNSYIRSIRTRFFRIIEIISQNTKRDGTLCLWVI